MALGSSLGLGETWLCLLCPTPGASLARDVLWAVLGWLSSGNSGCWDQLGTIKVATAVFSKA